MGVDLHIWSNHDLKWSENPIDIIEQIENRINAKVQFYDFNEKNRIGDKDLFEKIEYYTFKKSFDLNFKCSQIEIGLDYKLLCSITIYKTAMRLRPIRFFIKWHKWTILVSKEFLKEEEEIEKWTKFYENWKDSHQYIKSIVSLFGGNEIYYINDHTYQLKEDLLYEGGDFNSLKEEFDEIGQSHELNYLSNNYEKVCSMNNWFYEQISKKTYCEFKREIDRILSERKSILDNDPAIYQVWGKLTKALCNDIELSNRLMMNKQYETVLFVSEVMEEVYFETKNKVFLKNIMQWEDEYPELKLKSTIESIVK